MATARAAAVVSMKLLIDTKAKRVLFAEAGKECVDFLFQLLSLPVATVVRLLGAEGMEGSWPNLYQSLKDLNHTYIEAGKTKDSFLKPVPPLSSSSVPLLALTLSDAIPTPTPTIHKKKKSFYRCGYGHGFGYCSTFTSISDDPNAVCPGCGRLMSTSLTYVAPPPPPVEVEPVPAPDGGGIVKGVVTYMVMDDLVIKPMSTISTISLLNKFNVKDVGVLEEKVVNLGMEEALKLLKASHHSKTVLTDVFF